MDAVVVSDDRKEKVLGEEAEEVEILGISDNSPGSLGSEAASLSLNLCRFVEEDITWSHVSLVLLSSGARIILRRESMPLVCGSVDCCGQKEWRKVRNSEDKYSIFIRRALCRS